MENISWSHNPGTGSKEGVKGKNCHKKRRRGENRKRLRQQQMEIQLGQTTDSRGKVHDLLWSEETSE